MRRREVEPPSGRMKEHGRRQRREGFFELGLLRERLADAFALTAPDFFVEDVRFDAAAARLTVLLAELFAALLADPRDEAADREAEVRVVRLVARAAFPAVAFLAALPRVADFAAVDFAATLREALFTADLAAALTERPTAFTALFAVVLRAPLLPDVAFAADLVERAVLFAAPRAAGLAAERVAPLLDAVPRLAAVEREEDAVDFAADFRAVDFAADFRAVDFAAVFFAGVFFAEDFAPLLRADVVFDAAAFPPVELRRAPLFLVERDVGLNASTAPVISWVSGFDLSSVGIAASFKGLRVQPSRLQGNVVIPSEFLLTESVESRTGTIPVDTFCALRAEPHFPALPKELASCLSRDFPQPFQRHARNKTT